MFPKSGGQTVLECLHACKQHGRPKSHTAQQVAKTYTMPDYILHTDKSHQQYKQKKLKPTKLKLNDESTKATNY